MKTKTYTVYKFEELPKDSQELAINKWRDDEEFIFLPDDMQYHLDELLKKHKIEGKANCYFSLSYSQGDGAMFEGSFDWKEYSIVIKQSGNYYHSYSKVVDIYDEEDIQIYMPKIEEDFEDLYQEICKDLEEYGYDVMKTAQEDENIIDILKSNDYDFTLDGQIN